MKILWVCNILLPEMARALGAEALPVGGWMEGMMNRFSPEDELVICAPWKEERSGRGERFTFHTFPAHGDDYSEQTEAVLAGLFHLEKPDLLHIHGTEFPHSLAAVRAAERERLLDRTVISIQGLISVYERHSDCYLPWEVIRGRTFRDLWKKESLEHQKRRFHQRGEYEREAIRKARYVIGRTEWDWACVRQINPEIRYFKGNETLRESFYSGIWDLDKCEKHSVFCGQSVYSIKGFHLALETLEILLRTYPDAELYTTGPDPFAAKTLLSRIKWVNSYVRYLKKLIREKGLEQKVHFLGSLDEQAMKERFLRSHVFLSASSVENSSNAVGEAMLLGVPVVSSFVGGLPSLMTHEREGCFYPADAPYMAAHYIRRIFEEPETAKEMARNARSRAMKTHDPEENGKQLTRIYQAILRDSGSRHAGAQSE